MISARLLRGSRISGTDRDVTVEWHLSGGWHDRGRRTRRPQSVQRVLVDPRKAERACPERQHMVTIASSGADGKGRAGSCHGCAVGG
jgi:hypothetical protein